MRERLCLVCLHFLCVLQKYLQQLWDTVLLVALILSTGVIVQARWQYQDHRLNDDSEVLDFTFVSVSFEAVTPVKPLSLGFIRLNMF